MRRFACGALCLALWVTACGDDDRTEPGVEVGEAGAEATAGGSQSFGGDGNGEAGDGAAARGGAPDVSVGGGATSGSGGDGGSSGTEPGGPIDVAGQLVDPRGRPIPGVSVEIGGEAVTTDANGRFAAEVVAPYDIVVRHPGTETDVYLGVTRADPKIVGDALSTNRSATLSGKLGGVGYPVPSAHETGLSIHGPDVGFSDNQKAGNTGAYSGAVEWAGGETTQATLFALQRSNLTSAFTAIGSRQVTLTDGELLTSPAANVTLVATTLRDLDVTISAPDGIDYTTIAFFVGNAPVPIRPPSSAFTVRVPRGIPEAVKLVMHLDATVDGRQAYASLRLPSSIETLSLEVGVPPAAISPADGETLSAATGGFQFTPESGAVSRLSFSYTEILAGGELRILHQTRVMTDDVSVPLSRLLTLDLDLPEGEQIVWGVSSRADAPSVDAFLAPTYDSVSDDHGGRSSGRQFQFQE